MKTDFNRKEHKEHKEVWSLRSLRSLRLIVLGLALIGCATGRTGKTGITRIVAEKGPVVEADLQVGPTNLVSSNWDWGVDFPSMVATPLPPCCDSKREEGQTT